MPAFDYSLVADIYDQYVRADFDVQFFRDEASRAHVRVLELMCGTGSLVSEDWVARQRERHDRQI